MPFFQVPNLFYHTRKISKFHQWRKKFRNTNWVIPQQPNHQTKPWIQFEKFMNPTSSWPSILMKVNPLEKMFHQDALGLFISEIRLDVRFQQKFQKYSTLSKFSILDLKKTWSHDLEILSRLSDRESVSRSKDIFLLGRSLAFSSRCLDRKWAK